MWRKKTMLFLWMVTLGIIFIVTIVNHKPYFIMGGSTSISPLMQTLIVDYPENHQEVDYTYNSLGSDAAILPVTNNIFGIGWLSKEYETSKDNLVSFVLSKDGMILVYNLPKEYLGDASKPLNFTTEKLQKMYSNKDVDHIFWSKLFPKDEAGTKYGWVKPDCPVRVLPYTRENGSGTRDVFNEKVLKDKKAYYPQAITVNSSTQMFSMAVGGVGYSSYSDKKQLLSNSKFSNIAIADWDGVAPSLETIAKDYELVRPFTGLINEKYSQIEALIKFLSFLFIADAPGHDKVLNAFSEDNYAQVAVSIKDERNAQLAEFLKEHGVNVDNEN